ncbi:MAG TPA: SDR family oxidoreductase [Acidothermaceae bacterium]|jgi:3-oxoacyl-[acyl-carrier protein] reductase/(S)-1-phenylethanol dehydrogenase
MPIAPRVALVTGGASGIGRAFAERLGSDGLALAIADLKDSTDAVRSIRQSGGTATSYACDVGDPDSVTALRVAVEADHGQVDVLVNCAGTFPLISFEDTSFEMWEQVLRVNLTSMFLTCKQFVPPMASRGFGRVVNISSRTFWINSPNYSAYIAAKAGVIGLTRALATEYGAYGVTVNALAPGLTRTEASSVNATEELFQALAKRQAIPRVPVPADLVGVISFLASDDSSFMTGQTFMVDGGLVRL